MGRKANGEGSIYERKDGRWAASMSLGNGRRKHFLGHSRSEVAEKLLVAMNKRQQGLPLPDERRTVRQYLRFWLDAAKPSLRQSTWTRYEELLRRHAVPAIGGQRLVRLTPQHLQGLYAEALGKGLAPATARQIHAILHRALKQAVGWGMVARNVADHVQPPRAPRQEMKTLRPDEVRRFLAAAEESRLGALFVLAVTSGLRQGEILALRWQDVDLSRGTVTVRASLRRMKKQILFEEPKSKKSRRQVVLSSVAVAALKHHRISQNEERLRAGSAWEDSGLVFVNERGRPLEVSNLTNRHFRPLLAQAGLPRIRFHDLRHTAATLMLAQNVNAKIVSEMLGHSQISITMDLYQHVTETMQREAARAVDAILQA